MPDPSTMCHQIREIFYQATSGLTAEEEREFIDELRALVEDLENDNELDEQDGTDQ